MMPSSSCVCLASPFQKSEGVAGLSGVVPPGKPGTYASPGVPGIVNISKSPGVASYSYPSVLAPTAAAVVTVRNGDINTAMVNYANWKGPHGDAGKIAQEKTKQVVDFERAISVVADFFNNLVKLHGDKLANEARYFAGQSVGKAIRNKTQALQAFDRYKNVLNQKFSAADRLAIANALSSMNAENMARQVKVYGKAFGVVGDFIQFSDRHSRIHYDHGRTGRTDYR